MLFITNPHLRRLEAFMQEVPNFPPKGNKVDLDRLEDEILLLEIESVTFNIKPANKNSTIRKDNIMKFRNDQHRNIFLKEAKKQSLKNYKIIAALYLLTADEKLWCYLTSKIQKREITEKTGLSRQTAEKKALQCGLL